MLIADVFYVILTEIKLKIENDSVLQDKDVIILNNSVSEDERCFTNGFLCISNAC